MPIEIKHRNTGAVLRTVNADTLSGANLYGADLRGADLRWANLSGATLTGANLGGADLSRADLTGANLIGANLSGATIDTDKLDRLLARAMRSDGYEFFFFALQEGSPKIRAGCRWMTIAEYRDHVAKHYPDTDKARETLRILDFFQATAEGL